MAIKLGINGFGRIGRLVFRAAVADGNIDIVGINDLSDAKSLAHLVKYDTTHGKFSGEICADGNDLVLGEHRFRLPTLDPSFVVDLAAAAVLAEASGATVEGIGRSLSTFAPGAHSRAVVGTWGGITWIDDSKATNPHAARAAAASYEAVILIAGGRNKGLDLSGIVGPTVRHLVAYGEAGPEIAATTAYVSMLMNCGAKLSAKAATSA